jgi:hypothetical protein
VQVDVQAETARDLADTHLGGDRGIGRQGFFSWPATNFRAPMKQAE